MKSLLAESSFIHFFIPQIIAVLTLWQACPRNEEHRDEADRPGPSLRGASALVRENRQGKGGGEREEKKRKGISNVVGAEERIKVR